MSDLQFLASWLDLGECSILVGLIIMTFLDARDCLWMSYEYKYVDSKIHVQIGKQLHKHIPRNNELSRRLEAFTLI